MSVSGSDECRVVLVDDQELVRSGLRRILRCIDLHGPDHRDAFIRALTRVRKITRGRPMDSS